MLKPVDEKDEAALRFAGALGNEYVVTRNRAEARVVCLETDDFLTALAHARLGGPLQRRAFQRGEGGAWEQVA